MTDIYNSYVFGLNFMVGKPNLMVSPKKGLTCMLLYNAFLILGFAFDLVTHNTNTISNRFCND